MFNVISNYITRSFVDMVGDILGCSEFSIEKKLWQDLAHIKLTRKIYDQNKADFDFRNKVIYNEAGHYCVLKERESDFFAHLESYDERNPEDVKKRREVDNRIEIKNRTVQSLSNEMTAQAEAYHIFPQPQQYKMAS